MSLPRRQSGQGAQNLPGLSEETRRAGGRLSPPELRDRRNRSLLVSLGISEG